MKKILGVLVGVLLIIITANAQETFPRNDVKDLRDEAYAFVNATIFQNSSTQLEEASLLIQKGKIVGIGKGIKIPDGTPVFDMTGRFIYPSFVEIHSNYGLPAAPAPAGFNFMQPEQLYPNSKGAFNANDAIKSSYNAIEQFSIDKKNAKLLRDLGFGSVLSFMPDGIARGTSVLVTLNDAKVNEVIINDRAAAHYSFKKGSSSQMFPVSIMGCIALLRQTHLDATWYQKQNNELFYDESLDAYLKSEKLPQIFSTSNLLNLLRAGNVGNEMGKKYIIKGSGEEYQRIDEVKSLDIPLIIPLNFPAPPDVSDPYEALDVSLKKMKHWEMAPGNLAALEENNVDFAISTAGLKDKSKFWDNLKKAVNHGLSEELALKALTENPAKFIRAGDKVGQLQPGMLANFIICTNGIFTDSVQIHENWVQGKRFLIKEIHSENLAGAYELSIGDTTLQLEVSGLPGKAEFKIVKNDTTDIKVKAKVEDKFINISFALKPEGETTRISGWMEDKNMKGSGQKPDGTWVSWSAKYVGEVTKKENSDEEKESDEDSKDKPDSKEHDTVGPMIYPFMAYGNTQFPEQEDILIKNATVWTNEKEGILLNTDVLIRDGKIRKIGKGLKVSGKRVIDGTDKHLTSGIIDEHTHVALSGVNDIAVNSSMVRMEDSVNPNDINIYRQLAGGVTAGQLLHGSANPIGGQSVIIKFRWGKSVKGLLIDGADKYIKFALGENVTRARSPISIRYPQSRMGVEQVYMDCFTRAKEYGEKWSAYNKLSPSEKTNVIPPRRELDLEPLLEIINEERFITCHSYVQSEINMLMKVAEQFGFTVNTFTHILEGYKVADIMKAHGAGGSTFADWYNYKYEVIDAIPYNATIMNEQGIVTAINSDDREMARRLNQEAAKSIKYGEMAEEDALKMVTLNPAKLLHLDDRMGSLKIGKDADVVIWTDHPLSIYAKAEKTIVDGTVYYDMEKDREMRKWIEKERGRLTQKIKNAIENGEKPSPTMPQSNHDIHCDDIFVETY